MQNYKNKIRWSILALALTAIVGASAQECNYLTIKHSGRVISIPIEDIEYVEFTEDDQTSDNAGYELRVLTFEDADYKGSPNYLGNSNWSSLIDSPQFGGPLLYGDYVHTDYRWYDQNNTELCAAIDPDNEDLVFWNGGEAISNYVNSQYAEEELDNFVQLSVPNGGNRGSKNFCVHNGYFDGVFYDEPSGGIWFHDNEARVIDHMYVCLTSYGLSIGLNGNRFCDPASSADWVRLVAIGTDAEGLTHETEITVCENGVFTTDWIKWDLSGLGEIVRLDFNIISSMKGEWGLNFPAYFAYDDIAVRFSKK